jgi:hypothetical protein
MADFNTMLATLSAGSDANITAIEFQSNQPTVRTQSLSGRTQTRTFGGQVWSATITMPPLTQADLRKVYAFLVKQKGSASTFTIAPINLTDASGTQSASETIATGASVGANAVTTSGSNQFAVGDMIKFSGPTGHTKAYMVTQVSGQTLTFEPGLVSAVTSSHTIESKGNFDMTVRLDGDEFKYAIDNTNLGSIEFSIVEAI